MLYSCVEETTVRESMKGKRGNPRIKPPFPAVKGLWQRPTVVNNVESSASVTRIIEMGGEAYSKIGVGRSTGTKLISACGNINKPGVYEIDMTQTDRKSTRLNSSHVAISYAVLCLKKKIKRSIVEENYQAAMR